MHMYRISSYAMYGINFLTCMHADEKQNKK